MFEYKVVDTVHVKAEQIVAALNKCGAEGYRVIGTQEGRIILEREAQKPTTRGRK